jgi:hypothetical protein
LRRGTSFVRILKNSILAAQTWGSLAISLRVIATTRLRGRH